MKSFRFSLEAVQTLRQRSEQAALEQYAATLLRRQKAWNALHEAEQAHASGCAAWRALMAAATTASDIQHAQRRMKTLETQRRELAALLAEAEREVNQALQTVQRARQNREVVDQVRLRAKQRFDQAVAQQEFREMDDLASRGSPLRPARSIAS